VPKCACTSGMHLAESRCVCACVCVEGRASRPIGLAGKQALLPNVSILLPQPSTFTPPLSLDPLPSTFNAEPKPRNFRVDVEPLVPGGVSLRSPDANPETRNPKP
jgi:hypothetical protein